jgi:hypothetical protein
VDDVKALLLQFFQKVGQGVSCCAVDVVKQHNSSAAGLKPAHRQRNPGTSGGDSLIRRPEAISAGEEQLPEASIADLVRLFLDIDELCGESVRPPLFSLRKTKTSQKCHISVGDRDRVPGRAEADAVTHRLPIQMVPRSVAALDCPSWAWGYPK